MVTFGPNTIRYITPVQAKYTIDRSSGTRRQVRSPKAKEITYWTYATAKEFLKEHGFNTLLEKDSINKLARLIDGHVRRRAHNRRIPEKLQDFQDLLERDDTTLGDLKQIILSGGRRII